MALPQDSVTARGIDYERVGASLFALAAVLVFLVPLPQGLLTALYCPFHRLTGLPCPTCGCTRALLSLSHGDLHAAFLFNPLFTLALAAWALWSVYALGVIAFALPRRRLSQAAARRAAWGLAAAATLNWIYLFAAGI